MRRLQTLIAIIFETHPRPAGSRSAPMAKNHLQTSILRSTRWDSDSTLASQSVKTRPLHCDCPKTEHRKPQTAPARRQAFPKRVLGPLQPPSLLNKDFSKGSAPLAHSARNSLRSSPIRQTTLSLRTSRSQSLIGYPASNEVRPPILQCTNDKCPSSGITGEQKRNTCSKGPGRVRVEPEVTEGQVN